MVDKPNFDKEHAHKYYSVNCFNLAWQLIDKSNRTPQEDEQMIRLAQASLWHWTQRSDGSAMNLSIGYWQVSRIYASLGEADNARKYAQLCMSTAPEGEPFFLGYAWEALARSEWVAGNREKAKDHLAEAWRQAEIVSDAKDKQLLVDDLKTLGG